MNSVFKNLNGEITAENFQLIELKDDPALLPEIKKLLHEYCAYMYVGLGSVYLLLHVSSK